MKERPLFILLTLASLTACGEVSELGKGMDSTANGGKGGRGGSTDEGLAGEDTGASEAGLGMGITSGAGSGTASMAVGGGVAMGGRSAGRGGRSSGAGQGGRDLPPAPLGGMGNVAGASSASGGVDGGMTGGMGPTGGTGPTSGAGRMGMGGGVDASCESNGIDTSQGMTAPSADDCDAVATARRNAHDQALQVQALSVAPLAGKWADGTGSNRVELILDATGAGTLRFGDASDFPAITDPTKPFLSTVGEDDANEFFDLAYLKAQPGFAYSVIPESGRGSEMSFHILNIEAWENWCSLQMPVQSPHSLYCYECTYDAGAYTFDNTESCGVPKGCFATDGFPVEANRVDCGRIGLCAMPNYSVCACTAEVCFANLSEDDQSQLTNRWYSATLDPVDTTVLRLISSTNNIDGPGTTYLQKEE